MCRLARSAVAWLASSRRNPYIAIAPGPVRSDRFPGGTTTAMSADTILTCRDCGQSFTFTSGEQDFYAARGYSEPSRCPDCRAQRKAERGGGGGGGGGYSSYSSGGGYSSSRAPREMFSATCSSCGKQAQVPFQPSGDKPVYCSDCFQQRGGNSRGGGYGGRSAGRGRY